MVSTAPISFCLGLWAATFAHSAKKLVVQSDTADPDHHNVGCVYQLVSGPPYQTYSSYFEDAALVFRSLKGSLEGRCNLMQVIERVLLATLAIGGGKCLEY